MSHVRHRCCQLPFLRLANLEVVRIAVINGMLRKLCLTLLAMANMGDDMDTAVLVSAELTNGAKMINVALWLHERIPA